ncbi:MAG TPA: septation protein SepH [Nocardioidaceae bacterium]|nr:septation protein SepH [Nocardioidaceae bacterium]
MKRQDLTLVGLTDDSSRLVLVSDSGEEFTLPADTRLRAALRGEHARLGQLEITMESTLRPRDIQARIRSGATPEQVAVAAQTTLERVMGYAVPVLAERAHIAGRAQRATVRRANGEGPGRVLADAVAERLHSRNVDPGSVEWDAWRRDDGRWSLVADYRSGESARHAEFVFDAPGSYVVAEDDEARWLVGEQTAVKGPQPRATPGPRRLSAVGHEDSLPLGEDALELVSEQRPAAATGTTGDTDWIATQASDRPQQVDAPAAPAELGSEADEVQPGAPEARVQADEAEPEAEAAEVDPEPSARESAPPAARRRRASVPSWDEIMFGGGKRE